MSAGSVPSPPGPEQAAAESASTPSTASSNPTGPDDAGGPGIGSTDAGQTDAGTSVGQGSGAAGRGKASRISFARGRARPDPGAAPRSRAGRFSLAGPEDDPQKRRRRRWFLGAVGAGAALIVLALCAGALAVIASVSDFREDADDVREDRAYRDSACLELEQRLNRLIPPGATGSPQDRARAVRNENVALRLHLGRLDAAHTVDGWRQLLDARTAYAEALDAQGPRTPAFYVAPRTGDGRAVTDELVRLSPDPCGGPIRRLQSPDL